MKKINKYLSVALAAAAVSSCADLDTQYYGAYVTTDQKEAAVAANADLAQAAVSAIFTQFGSLFGQYSSNHYDFGYPALMIGLDSQTADFHSRNSGYNWYSSWEGYDLCDETGVPTGMMWLETYKQIRTANALIATIDPETEDADLQFSLAQGLAVRAFDYWVLAQCYQFNGFSDGGNFTPYGSQKNNSLCVPIVTDLNEQEVAANGAPRATVVEVYDQILSDINTAIDLLAASGVTPAEFSESSPKRMVSLAAAYGLRARVNLTMHKYADAATDAQNAIDAFSGRPYTAAEVSVPAFTSSDDASWMWAISVASTDRPVTSGICNWPSMMGSFNYGYITVGSWRWISKTLYESIPATDVRKGWWLDENYESDHLTAAQQNYLNGYRDPENDVPSLASKTAFIMPYTQVKYGLFGGAMGEYCTAHEIPLMRVEEMYLILAEAQGMSSSVATGKSTLESFVKAYRDPSYSCAATTAADFQDEVLRQRRIELWGEGLAFFDVMRLNKAIDRVGTDAADAFNFSIAPGSACLIYCIPQDEIVTNAQISSSDNNDAAPSPTPIAQ